jgi:hypothetical protein
LTPPEQNPLYNTLKALAAPADWAAVSRDQNAKPGRLNVRLTLRRSHVVRHVELKAKNESIAEQVWLEFELWFCHPKKVLSHQH